MDEKAVEEVLGRDGFCVSGIEGISMRPMLKGSRDFAVIRRPDGPLNRFDVALYRRTSGRLVLHRVIAVRKDGYDMRGDNCLATERGVGNHQLLGVLTGFYRGGRYVGCENRAYRLYARLWHALFPLRAVYLTVRSFRRPSEKEAPE